MNSKFHSLKLACVTAIILLSSLGCGREENPLPAHQEFDFDFKIILPIYSPRKIFQEKVSRFKNPRQP